MFTLIQKLGRRMASETSGAASVELVIVFPVVFMLFVSAFEIAMMNIRAVMLERATDIVVRSIRINDGPDLEYADVVARICDQTLLVPDCTESVKIEMIPVSKSAWNTPTPEIDCVKRDEDIDPVISFQNGLENELMLVRVCAVVDPLFPTMGIGRTMPKDVSGGYRIVASSAFVNEPN